MIYTLIALYVILAMLSELIGHKSGQPWWKCFLWPYTAAKGVYEWLRGIWDILRTEIPEDL